VIEAILVSCCLREEGKERAGMINDEFFCYDRILRDLLQPSNGN
jgi:hypothetical protein